MNTHTILCTGLLVFWLLCLCGMAAAQQQDAAGTDASGTVLSDDIQPYHGPIGPDSPLYGLKLALEDMDESFTVNETERVDKEMDHARLRLSEVRQSLELNESDSVQQALNNYWLKMNPTNVTIARWNSTATRLHHAQEMIVKHQFVLEHLLASHPDNTGLRRAYENSIRLEEKFAEKTAIRFNRTTGKNNQTIIRAIRLEQKENDRKGLPKVTTPSATVTPEFNHNTPHTQLDYKNMGKDNRQDSNGNSNSGDKGKGNSRNK